MRRTVARGGNGPSCLGSVGVSGRTWNSWSEITPDGIRTAAK